MSKTMPKTSRKQISQNGFTLIEVMITVVIITVLAAIAIPSYNRHVQNTRRAAVQTEMLEMAQNLERCRTRTNSYDECNLNGTEDSEDGNYTVATAPDANSFTITATPVAGTLQADDKCGVMTLDEIGVTTPDDPADCWE